MGKRSDFKRKPRDNYPTPLEAVMPLIPHLIARTKFCEPCAGSGKLIEHLKKCGHICSEFADIMTGIDATTAIYNSLTFDCFITNPPWDRDILHPIIHNLRNQFPAWLLIDADWAHTRQAAPYLKFCTAIVAIGRVKWIPGSKHTGKDNCCWYRFVDTETSTRFHGRL